MSLILRSMSFLRAIFRRRTVEGEAEAEWRFHVDARADTLEAQGLSRADASRQAEREFGDVLRWRAQTRDAWGLRFARDMVADARYAVRQMRREPGFTAVAVLTLALGIGANTAIFSIVNAVFLRPLPYPEATRLFRVQRINNRAGGFSISPAIYEKWRTRSDLFDAVGIVAGARALTLLAAAHPVSVQTVTLTPGVLRALGVQPRIGHLPGPDEETEGSDTAVISESLWRAQFGADPGILGKVVLINANQVAIVGVMPDGFELPFSYTKSAQVWLSYRLPPGSENNASNGINCIGRLRDGVSPAQAAAALTPPLAALARQFPQFILPNEQGALVPLGDAVRAGAGTAPLLLLGAVTFVLLIACVNIANLLLARTTARQREMAIRTSLGASRGRVLRQVLTETALLGGLGAIAGLAICRATFNAVLGLVPADLPYVGAIRLDAPVLLFAIALGLCSGILFGVAPAVVASKPDRTAALKSGARSGMSRERRLLGSALTISEIALGLVLLVGAALLLQSFSQLTHVDLGFDPGHVMTFTMPLPRTYDTRATRLAVYDQLRARVASRAGVQQAAYINGLPLTQGDLLFRAEGRSTGVDAIGDARVRFASPDYFDVMHIPIVRGRSISSQDSETSDPVMIVSRSLAERFWPGGDAIGSFVWIGQPMGPAQAERAPRRIVGIAGDIHGYAVAGGVSDDMYEPAAQSAGAGLVSFAVRTTEEPREFTPAVSAMLRETLPDQATPAVRSMDDVVAASASINTGRFHAVLLGLFGALGLLIVTLGVFGVASYVVAQRTREFGLRLALGATPGRIRAMVLKDGLLVAAVGVAIGLAASFAVTRLLASMLFGVPPRDPITLAGASAVMIVVAVGASWIPARRATRVDPLVTMRCE